MPTTVDVNLYHLSPVVPKITVNYSADARADFDIDVADQYPPDATVKFTLQLDDEDGAKILDGLVMSYEALSDGVYIGTGEPAPGIQAKQRYFWTIDTTTAAGIEQSFNGFERGKYNDGS